VLSCELVGRAWLVLRIDRERLGITLMAIAECGDDGRRGSFLLFERVETIKRRFGRRAPRQHLLFDEQADAILDSIDPLAERVRKLGGTTIRSVGDISRQQTIPDDNDEFVPPLEMVQRLLADNRHIAEQQRAAIAICDEHRDTPTGSLLQDLLDQTERRIWFLFEISQQDRAGS